MKRVEELLAEIADLKARIRSANKYITTVGNSHRVPALDLRTKNWKPKT